MLHRFLLAAYLLLTLSCGTAWACKCRQPPPPKEAMEGSAAVFSCKVTAVKELDERRLEVTIKVIRRWKGALDKAIVATVVTNRDGAACGYGFEKDKSYLVYANTVSAENDDLAVNSCSRTCLLDQAADDLKQLGEGSSATDQD